MKTWITIIDKVNKDIFLIERWRWMSLVHFAAFKVIYKLSENSSTVKA